MIDCPNCKTSSSPSFRCCPRCQNHFTPYEERFKYLKRRAEELVMEGLSKEDLFQWLLDEGLSEVEASAITQDSTKAVHATNRGFGYSRLFVGLLMLSVGLLVIGILVTVILSYGPQAVFMRRKGYPAIAFAVVGILLVSAGLYASLSGARSAITGK